MLPDEEDALSFLASRFVPWRVVPLTRLWKYSFEHNRDGTAGEENPIIFQAPVKAF